MKNKFISVVGIALIALAGCAPTSYSALKTGPDRYTVTGSDPNQVQSLAYKSCKDDGFDDYSVLDNSKGRMIIRCEKTPPPEPGIMAKYGPKAEQAWDYVKQKVDEYSKKAADKIPDSREDLVKSD